MWTPPKERGINSLFSPLSLAVLLFLSSIRRARLLCFCVSPSLLFMPIICFQALLRIRKVTSMLELGAHEKKTSSAP
jgi:hypothetical protein